MECTKVNCPMQAGTPTDRCDDNCPWRTTAKLDDLISRALALEVINAVKGITWSQSGKVLCGKMYSQIKDLPAVDAIPVEWIFEQMQILHELHNKNEYVLQWLIELWQREQEEHRS